MRIETQNLLIDRLSTALSMSSLQHRVIANNIANVNTQGFIRQRVTFDEAMDAARLQADASTPPSATVAAHARIDADPSESQSGVEADMLALSVNTMRYSTLARVLSRYLSIADAIASNTRA